MLPFSLTKLTVGLLPTSGEIQVYRLKIFWLISMTSIKCGSVRSNFQKSEIEQESTRPIGAKRRQSSYELLDRIPGVKRREPGHVFAPLPQWLFAAGSEGGVTSQKSEHV
jgi:hypothetical protein